MIFSTGILFALISALLATLYALLSRVWVKESSSPLAISALYTFFSFIASAGLLIFEPWEFTDATPFFIGLLLLSSILYGLYDAVQFFARKYVDASSLALLLQLVPVITFTLSLLILSEDFSYLKFFAVVLIVLGNIVALAKFPNSMTRHGLLFGIASAAFLGLAYTVDKVAFEHFPVALYSMSVYFIPFVVVTTIFFLRRGRFQEITNELARTSWRMPVLSLIGVAAYYALLNAYRHIDASVAVPLQFTSTALTIIGGIILLRERNNVGLKIAGACLVFIGILLLSQN